MFEDLKANIQILEGKDCITAEDLLDSMCRLFDGAKAKNIAVVDAGAYGNALINLFDRVIPSYRQVADLLSQLNDEDVDDVISESRKISDQLTHARRVLEQLAEERKKYADVQAEYEREEAKRKQLQAEVDELKKIPIEDVRAAEKKLKDELDRCTQNAESLANAEAGLKEAQDHANTLKMQLEDATQKKQEAEDEVAQMQTDIEALERLKEALEKKKEAMQQASSESASALTAIKNAWESIRQREDLPFALEPVEELRGVSSDITSFAELEQWFDHMEAGLEKGLTAYTEMYREILCTLGKAVR